MSIPVKNIPIENPSPDDKLPFGKALFEYCTEMYKGEIARQEALDSKSRFYLSFITLLLGAFFLKLDFLDAIKKVLIQRTIAPGILVIIYICIIVLGASLFISLIAILFSVGVKSYMGVFPEDPTNTLLSQESNYFEKQDLPTLYETLSIGYTEALDVNKSINDKKAKWIKISAFFILITILSLLILLGLIGYIMYVH